MKVLIVDDEKEIADLIEVYLMNEGFSVVKANSGKEAYDYIETEDGICDEACQMPCY